MEAGDIVRIHSACFVGRQLASQRPGGCGHCHLEPQKRPRDKGSIGQGFLLLEEGVRKCCQFPIS